MKKGFYWRRSYLPLVCCTARCAYTPPTYVSLLFRRVQSEEMLVDARARAGL